MSLFERLGVPLKTERGNRVFPVSDKAVDIVDELAVQKMQRDMLRANARAFAAVGTSACNMERTDNVEHLLFEGIHICLLCGIVLIAIKYALTAATCRTYVSASVATNALAQFLAEEFKLLLG